MVSRGALRQNMMGHAEAERKCIHVSGDNVSYNKKCLKEAVPKGTNASVWTESDRQQARSIYTD